VLLFYPVNYRLTKVSVSASGICFVCGPMRHDAVVDFGLFGREVHDFLRGFAEPEFRRGVKPGWEVSVPEVWRRNPVHLVRRGEAGVRYLTLTKPDGKSVVFEFRYSVLPEGVVAEMQSYAESFGKENDHAGRQQRDESVSAEEGSASAGGPGGVDAAVGEGGAGELSADDGEQGLSGVEAGGSWGRSERGLLEVGESEEGDFTPEEIESLAANLNELRLRERFPEWSKMKDRESR
jgi:hypothetical protein